MTDGRPAWVTPHKLASWARWVAEPATPEDVAAAVVSARAATAAWAALSSDDRAGVVLRFHDLLVERQDQLTDLIQWELGETSGDARSEVLRLADVARQHPVRGAVPVGVVGIISPGSHSLLPGVGEATSALLAGYAVVGTADPQARLTLLWTRALMAEAGLPHSLWQIVTGPDADTDEAVVAHADRVGFTAPPGAAQGKFVALGNRRRRLLRALRIR